jgi:hypothetical protein
MLILRTNQAIGDDGYVIILSRQVANDAAAT